MAADGKEKKRKAITPTAQVTHPHKKSKKSTGNNNATELLEKSTVVAKSIADLQNLLSSPVTQPNKAETAPANDAVVQSKKPRRRAADFMTDDEVAPDTHPYGSTETRTVTATEPVDKPKKEAKKNKTKGRSGASGIEVNGEIAAKTEASVPFPTGKDVTKKPEEMRSIYEDDTDSSHDKADPLLTSGYLHWGSHEKERRQRQPEATQHSLTADGVNGIVEHSSEEDVETTSANKHTSTSLQAEAQRTVDQELDDEYGSDAASEADEDDQGAALLAGFDSDSEDHVQDEVDVSDPISKLPLPKEAGKKIKKALAKSNDDGPGTVYVGRVPHGFFEHQMRAYFSQFGVIKNLRLSRNRRTGASKHFAFIQFESCEVAKIVASVMDNYLMFGHILKCKFAPEESLHPDTWKGANKRFKIVPYTMLEKKRLEAPRTKEQWEKKGDKEQKKREKKAAELEKLMGYKMELPKLRKPGDILEQKKAQQAEEQKTVDEVADESGPVGALEAPSGVPRDEVALKKSKKSKKSKKDERVETPHVTGADQSLPDVEVDNDQDEVKLDAMDSVDQTKDKPKKKKKAKMVPGTVELAKGADLAPVIPAQEPATELLTAESSTTKKSKKKEKRQKQKVLEAQLSAQLNSEMQATTSDGLAAPAVTAVSQTTSVQPVITPSSDDEAEAAAPVDVNTEKKSKRKRKKKSSNKAEHEGGVTLPTPIPAAVAETHQSEKKEKAKKRKSEGEVEIKAKSKKTKTAV